MLHYEINGKTLLFLSLKTLGSKQQYFMFPISQGLFCENRSFSFGLTSSPLPQTQTWIYKERTNFRQILVIDTVILLLKNIPLKSPLKTETFWGNITLALSSFKMNLTQETS